jgi:hypothetical protein
VKTLTAVANVLVTALSVPAALENDVVTGFEIVKDAGNHDGFATGRWCEVATKELGL